MFYISLLQPLKSRPLIYKVPPLPPVIINNSNSSYLLTWLIICNKKYNLNNLNFLLSGKDIKHKPRKFITRLRLTRLPLVKEFYKDYPLRPALAEWI
jgi:hypothetical protein